MIKSPKSSTRLTLMVLLLKGLLLSAPSLSSSAIAASPSGISLTIDGVRSAKGDVHVLIFKDKKAYSKLNWRKAVGYTKLSAAKGKLQHVFPKLKKGPYAVFLFHDENGDGDFNTEGEIPLEGFSISGMDTIMDEPSFEDASISAGPITVKMFYVR